MGSMNEQFFTKFIQNIKCTNIKCTNMFYYVIECKWCSIEKVMQKSKN